MKTIRIGAVINATLKPSRDFLVGLEQSAQEQMLTYPGLMLKFFLGSSATTMDNLETFMSADMDVVVFSGMGRDLPFRLLGSLKRRPPAVFAEYTPFSEEDWERLGDGAMVMFDNEAIGRRAADFFIARGLRNFAFLSRNGYREDVTGSIRGQAFLARLREVLGEKVNYSEKTIGEFAENEDYWEIDQERTASWVESLQCPCGIFVNGDRLAFKLAQGCRRRDIPVPDRFEILGIDNNNGCCEKAIPAITAIVPGIDRFAEKTVEVALALALNPKLRRERHVEVVSASELVERGSTAIGRGYGRVAVRAKEFIRANACKGISVLNVAKGLGVSRRTLEIRVREATGKSVHTLISEIRLDEICRLLKETDLPISEVITRSGYALTTNAFVLFKKTFGMTMREYRRANRKPQA